MVQFILYCVNVGNSLDFSCMHVGLLKVFFFFFYISFILLREKEEDYIENMNNTIDICEGVILHLQLLHTW